MNFENKKVTYILFGLPILILTLFIGIFIGQKQSSTASITSNPNFDQISKSEELNEKINLTLQPGEVDAYTWFNSNQLRILINEDKEELINGYQLNYDTNKFNNEYFVVNIFKNMSMGHKLGLIDFLNNN
jgi:Fe-S cluster assembly iron-binding protein IscA